MSIVVCICPRIYVYMAIVVCMSSVVCRYVQCVCMSIAVCVYMSIAVCIRQVLYVCMPSVECNLVL